MSYVRPSDIIVGLLVNKAYQLPFLADPATIDLSDLGYTLTDILYSKDKDGIRPFGFIANAEDQGQVVIFRGTEAWSEWANDTDIKFTSAIPIASGKIHHGFFGLYINLQTKEGDDTLWRKRLDPDCLLVAGHSLGGALATFLATEIQARSLVTFGCPKCGDEVFAASATSLLSEVVRYVVRYDVVTQLPMQAFGQNWTHISGPVVLDDKKPNNYKLAGYHSLDTYISLLKNKSMV